MKTIPISELEVIAEEVRNGEMLEIVDGGKTLAKIVPVEPAPPLKTPLTDEEWLEQLAREGKVTRGTGTFPDWFFTEPLPESEDGSVLEQLLADRRKNDW
jgi:antitoxin (DNA-binding transcriptional repressor) of toxin-antitoxin stability system